jgi:UDP-glucose 4-epimerase
VFSDVTQSGLWAPFGRILLSGQTRFDDHVARVSEPILALADQPVLVTGAAGFIGSHLCRRLADQGAIVHAVSRRPPAKTLERSIGHLLDVADPKSVERLIADVAPRYVFHLASRVSGSRDVAEVATTFDSNLASTVHLLRAITNTACQRIVLAGSLEQADSVDGTPSSPYAASKSAAAMYARMFFELYQTPVTVARLFMVYGPGQRDARKLVPYVAVSLLSGRTPKLTSGVRPVDWVYVDDVADALISCALTPGLEGKTIDVGTGQMTSVRSVAEQISRLVGRGTPVFGAVDDRPSEQVRKADPSQASEMIGRPLTSLDEGLRQTIAWYRAGIERGEIDPITIDQTVRSGATGPP